MSDRELAGPSRNLERPKKRVNVYGNYCGLTDHEVRAILSLGDENLYLSDKEPFIDSGSEYQAESDSEISLDSSEEENFQEENENCVKKDEQNEYNDLDGSGVSDEGDNVLKWDIAEFRPTVFEFDASNSGIKNQNLSGESSELDFFLVLFDEAIIDLIVENTNLYAKQKGVKNWKDVDKGELFVFLALTLLMPHVKKSDIKNYWNSDFLYSTPFFREAMSRDRYLLILRNLHFQNNEVQSLNNRLHKIGPVLDMIQKNFENQFYPFQNLVIDESMILFKGRLLFKQYIKTKRHRFGIKLFVLCDCETAYILNFIVYVGKETEKSENQDSLGVSGAVVVKLLQPYLNKGHSFYSDNYYTSPVLSTYLHAQKTNSCGTVRTNRKHLPKFEKKMKKREIDFRSSENILAIKWKDRRDVHMLSTIHENKMVTLPTKDRITKEYIKKPLCVVDYNKQMGAIDKTDMMISSLDCTRKTIKWYKKLFLHALDLCLLNAHALYLTQHEETVSFPKFHMTVIRQLLERYPPQQKRNVTYDHGLVRLNARHFVDEVPRKDRKPQFRRCKVCSTTTKGEKKRKNTRYMCKDCDVGLCVTPCFRVYHEEAHF